MRTTIDKSGRVVIPRQLREAIGLVPGEVELVVDGGGIRIEPASGSGFVERDGRLVIDAEIELDDDDVRAMRLGTQK